MRGARGSSGSSPLTMSRGSRRRRGGASKPSLLQSYPSSRAHHTVFATTATVARRRRKRRILIALLIVLALVAAFVWWSWKAPAALSIQAVPADALISLTGRGERTGSLVVTECPPGTYSARVTRAGFATRTVEVEVKRFKGGSARIVLSALPQRLAIRATPEKAAISVSTKSGEKSEGEGSLVTTLPSGPVTIRITCEGRNPYERKLFLDRATSISTMLDPEGQIVQSVSLSKCSGAPKAVAITPDGSEAWATILNGPPSIEIFEPSSGRRIGAVELGKDGAVEVVFSKNGKLAYASQMETAKVFEIDVATRAVLRTFDTQSSWTKVVALSPDEKTLYAANWSGDDVSQIDLTTGKLVRRIPVADTPRGLWPTADGASLYVASFADGVLERIDLATGKANVVFDEGGALRHLVADEQQGVLYASDMAEDCVWATTLATGVTRKFASVGHKPNTIDLSPDGRILFVSDRGENNEASYYLPGPEWGSILLLDTASGRPLDGIVGGNQCTALDVSSDGKTLVFSDFLDDRLRTYRVPAFATLLKGSPGRAATLAKDVVKE